MCSIPDHGDNMHPNRLYCFGCNAVVWEIIPFDSAVEQTKPYEMLLLCNDKRILASLFESENLVSIDKWLIIFK